jgi:hypothetical protein
MEDNINDDTLDNPINIQSENLSEEIISTNNADNIITPHKETENMEVHHHPDLHHKPKKWKEYFLELERCIGLNSSSLGKGERLSRILDDVINIEKERRYITR